MMFLVSPNPTAQTQDVLANFADATGNVPPHFALLATVNPKRFLLFAKEIAHLANHPNIQPEFFAFVRLHIAATEGFRYCIGFNTALLLSKGYSESLLEQVRHDITHIPLDDRHKLLATMAIQAVKTPEMFHQEAVEMLLHKGWGHDDIYDAIDHAAMLYKNARIIKAYSL